MLEYMAIFLIFTLGIFIGKILLNNWFNHITVYSILWSGMLFLYKIRLISYNEIIFEAWLYILFAWAMLILGSIFANLRYRNTKTKRLNIKTIYKHKDEIIYIKILLIISSFAILTQWILLIKKFGSIREAMSQAELIYKYRVEGDLGNNVPYIGALILTAACLAGINIAKSRKITIITIMPLIFQTILELGMVGRAGIIVIVIIYISSIIFFSNSINKKIYIKKSSIMIIFIITFIGLGFIGKMRKPSENYSQYGESPVFSILREKNIPLFTPGLYLYISGNPVVFSEYLKDGGRENNRGYNTFAFILRIFVKMKLINPFSGYQKFYYIPVPMNTGTYIREIHSDFGMMGALTFPFILGYIFSYVFIRNKHSYQYRHSIILSFLMVIIVMSIFNNYMRMSGWIIAFGIAYIIGNKIDKDIIRIHRI